MSGVVAIGPNARASQEASQEVWASREASIALPAEVFVSGVVVAIGPDSRGSQEASQEVWASIALPAEVVVSGVVVAIGPPNSTGSQEASQEVWASIATSPTIHLNSGARHVPAANHHRRRWIEASSSDQRKIEGGNARVARELELQHTTNSQDVGVNSGVVGNRGEEGVWAQIASLFSADTNGRSLAIQHSLFFQREA